MHSLYNTRNVGASKKAANAELCGDSVTLFTADTYQFAEQLTAASILDAAVTCWVSGGSTPASCSTFHDAVPQEHNANAQQVFLKG